ncbi:nuclear transport factor 2 family protein [Singulisphaera sp. PoT]|uniref:nuclear transport factor 2 family protein n=1 Tax=Singulisphaera sp. PoT TaxID=3411797 RepID=UPI003BF46751
MRDHVEELKEAYAAWHETKGESVDVWLALMDEDIVLRSLAEGGEGMEFSSTRRGLAEARRYFSELRDQWALISFIGDEFIVQDDRVVVLGQGVWRSRRTGKIADTPLAHFWKFRAGKAIEYYEFYDTARAFAAALPD